MPHDDATLSPDAIDQFMRDGYLKIDQAIEPDVVGACRDWMWQQTGLSMDEPASWTEPVVRIFGSQDESFMQAMNSPPLHVVIDQLVGPGRWQCPIEGTGSFPIRFPSTQDPGDAGWHIDGSYYVSGQLYSNYRSRDRLLLMLMLFSDVSPNDAPTRIRRGSHRLVPQALLPAGENGRPFTDVIPRIEGLEDLEIDLATGKAGDVYVCHPFLVHAANWPHTGSSPRFLSQPGLAPVEQITLDRADGAYSPVEQVIVDALE